MRGRTADLRIWYSSDVVHPLTTKIMTLSERQEGRDLKNGSFERGCSEAQGSGLTHLAQGGQWPGVVIMSPMV